MPHVDNGGLQAHSIGELYPWTIAGRGVNPVKWQAQNLLTGEKGPLRHTYASAESDARRLKKYATLYPGSVPITLGENNESFSH